MGEILLAVVTGILAFVGLVSMISALCMSFYRLSAGQEEYIILLVSGHMEDIEFRIRGAAVRRRRIGGHPQIYLANFGADAETAEIAKRMCREFEWIEWVEGCKLAEKLRGNINARNKK